MINRLSRRLVRHSLYFRLIILFSSLSCLIYIISFVAPDPKTIILFLSFVLLALVALLTLFLPPRMAFFLAVATVFFLFLKAFAILSTINITLAIIFLVLLGIYLHSSKRP